MPVVHLVLEHREPRLGDSVVVARAGATDRESHVELLRESGVFSRCVLSSAVRVKDRVRCDAAVRVGHPQRVADQLGAHVRGHRPAHHFTVVEVDHGRQIEPSLARAQVGDVPHEPLAGPAGGEVPADQVGAVVLVVGGDRGALARPGLDAEDPQLVHDAAHQPLRGADAAPSERGEHPPEPVHAVRLSVYRADLLCQPRPPGCGRRERALPFRPGVVAGARDLEEPGHEADRVVGLLRVHERELLAHRCSFAKKAAAFFKNVFSSASLRFSASSRAIRSASGAGGAR